MHQIPSRALARFAPPAAESIAHVETSILVKKTETKKHDAEAKMTFSSALSAGNGTDGRSMAGAPSSSASEQQRPARGVACASLKQHKSFVSVREE